MKLEIDSHKLGRLYDVAQGAVNSDELRREGRVFFIGANLPVYSTLETMYESYCQESSELFHVSFGGPENFEQNIEMVRQIKRNFSIRIMGRIGYHLSESQIERVYLAGLDIVDLPGIPLESNPADDDSRAKSMAAFKAATEIFTRWSVVSSILVGQSTPQLVRGSIDELLRSNVIPLLDFAGKSDSWSKEEIGDSFRYIAAKWRHDRVLLKSVMPLLRLTTPFVLAEKAGYLRDVIDKLEDRRILATSDLRRHLRTRGAEASFESAGL